MATYDLYNMTSNVKYPKEWISLRHEIEEWATDYRLPYQVPSASNYRNLKISVYTPIKLVLGIKSIDNIKSDQVPKARKIFYKVKAICEGGE